MPVLVPMSVSQRQPSGEPTLNDPLTEDAPLKCFEGRVTQPSPTNDDVLTTEPDAMVSERRTK